MQLCQLAEPRTREPRWWSLCVASLSHLSVSDYGHGYILLATVSLSSHTLKPMLRKHSLCASICAAQSSSPCWTTHSSRILRVSGHAQQILQGGFGGSSVEAAEAAAAALSVGKLLMAAPESMSWSSLRACAPACA